MADICEVLLITPAAWEVHLNIISSKYSKHRKLKTSKFLNHDPNFDFWCMPEILFCGFAYFLGSISLVTNMWSIYLEVVVGKNLKNQVAGGFIFNFENITNVIDNIKLYSSHIKMKNQHYKAVLHVI